MILSNLRSLVLGGLLLGLASGFALSVNANAAQLGNPTQICNSAPAVYTIPAGTAQGSGATKTRAQRNAYAQMTAIRNGFVANCAKCPATGIECEKIQTKVPPTVVFGSPVYDFNLQMWVVPIYWTQSTTTQWCEIC